MVNNWDRVTGKLYPKQAGAVRNMIPDHVREQRPNSCPMLRSNRVHTLVGNGRGV